MVGVRLAKAFELFGRPAVLEAASRVHVGQDDGLFGAQALRGPGHEFAAAKGAVVAVGLSNLARHLERTAAATGEVLNLGILWLLRVDNDVAALADTRRRTGGGP